jgi:hypothetical protein
MSFDSVAAVPPSGRVIPFTGNYATVKTNSWISPTAVMLDPRG